MAKNRKTVWRGYFAWDYEKEIADLNRASEQGWQLVKGGLLHCNFEKNPEVRYRYQLDYRKVEGMGRYIETFREQGWEYVNSTWNNWNYFRKPWDPALPEEAYEIFTDRESLEEMRGRLAKGLLIAGFGMLAAAIAESIECMQQPNLPNLLRILLFLLESCCLLRGAWILKHPKPRQHWRGSVAAFLVLLMLGFLCSQWLHAMRPGLHCSTQAESISVPVAEVQWTDFDIKYPDNYFLDLDVTSNQPIIFTIQNEAGESVYTQSGTSFREEDLLLHLPTGHYTIYLHCEAGYQIDCSLN